MSHAKKITFVNVRKTTQEKEGKSSATEKDKYTSEADVGDARQSGAIQNPDNLPPQGPVDVSSTVESSDSCNFLFNLL